MYRTKMGLLAVALCAGCGSSSTSSPQSPAGSASSLVASQTNIVSTATPKSIDVSVHGFVKYDGKALEGVTVFFLSKDGQTAGTQSKADGSYSLSVGKAGSYRVAVSPSDSKRNRVELPARYQDGTTSGLVFELKEGPNEIHLELTSH